VARVYVEHINPARFTVATAILEFGERRHHSTMTARSLLASLQPWTVLGCLPGLVQAGSPQVQRPSVIEWQGKTFQPSFSAYPSAASSMVGSLIVSPRSTRPPVPPRPGTGALARLGAFLDPFPVPPADARATAEVGSDWH